MLGTIIVNSTGVVIRTTFEAERASAPDTVEVADEAGRDLGAVRGGNNISPESLQRLAAMLSDDKSIATDII